MGKKNFGNVHAIRYASGDGPQRPGVSINLSSDRAIDAYDGEWLRLDEAKKLHKNLGECIAYIEGRAKRQRKAGGEG